MSGNYFSRLKRAGAGCVFIAGAGYVYYKATDSAPWSTVKAKYLADPIKADSSLSVHSTELSSRNLKSQLASASEDVKNKTVQLPGTSLKRNDFLGWEEFFMMFAFVAARKTSADDSEVVGDCTLLPEFRPRGEDYRKHVCRILPRLIQRTMVGCVIVDHNKHIVGTGHGGTHSSLPPSKDKKTAHEMSDLHAEATAIANKIGHNLSGFTLYTTGFPCPDCTKLIIQEGIKEVVYLHHGIEKESTDSCRLLEAWKIPYRPFHMNREAITVTVERDQKL